MILIPFQSFSELVAGSDQIRTLAGIHDHLEENGRFTCTLPNRAVRLKRADGLLRLLRRCELGSGEELLVRGCRRWTRTGTPCEAPSSSRSMMPPA
jgi:hypothetical protein